MDFLYSHAMNPIEELSKTKLKAIRKITQKKYRTESKKFLVEGLRSVEEALASDWEIDSVLMTSEFSSDAAHQKILHQVSKRNTAAYLIPSKELDAITDTVHSQGIIAIVQQSTQSINYVDRIRIHGMVVAVEEVTEPGNLGTMIRTCDWFGVDAMLMSKDSVELYNPKVVRATMGSIFHLPIITEVDIVSSLERLKKNGFHVYATLIEEGTDVTKVHWNDKAVLVFGNEARGISPDVLRTADARIRIPRFGKAESLNVGIACGVVSASLRFRLSSKS